ncbi:E3 ubiquitin-protein ligase HECW2-like isoform X2 [Oscarella lobularis]|uniref:E3 ubiquitin-protein ligase HECW2-like isoform X2 n=1 Tax=Oscarella lobularis TaxID=121494 RepID=UPI0033136448
MAFRHRLARLASRSETDLTSIDHVDDMRRSLLVVSKSTVRVGESIDVKWDVTVPCDPDDWIGICRAGDVPTLSTCPEIKNRGVNGARKGKISWTIASHVIPSSQSSRRQKYHYFVFHYMSSQGTTPIASSDIVTVAVNNDRTETDTNRDMSREFVTLKISDIRTSRLKRSLFRHYTHRNPQITLSVRPGWGVPEPRHRVVQTDSTRHSHDQWNYANIPNILVTSSDKLEFEVRDHRRMSHRFLGRVIIEVGVVIMLNKRSRNVSLRLGPRTAKDKVSGTLSFCVDIAGGNDPTAGEERRSSSSAAAVITTTNDDSGDLPAGWSRRHSTDGRPFFVNHIRQTTQWERPTTEASAGAAASATATAVSTPLAPSTHASSDAEQSEGLPPNWTSARDQHGRLFYIDHANRRTQWERPTTTPPESTATASTRAGGGDDDEVQRRRRQLDTRYRSVRRTLRGRTETSAVSVVVADGESDAANETDGNATRSARELPSQAMVPETVRRIPAVRFLMRSDLLTLVQQNTKASSLYRSSTHLPAIVTKIRHDPNSFQRYQHSRDLIKLLNLFADVSMEFPPGWEQRYDASTEKIFFIDHASRATSFIDPRLPLEEEGGGGGTSSRRVSQSTLGGGGGGGLSRAAQTRRVTVVASSSSRRTRRRRNRDGGGGDERTTPDEDDTELAPLTYNQKVVAFFRQPDIKPILRAKAADMYADVENSVDKVVSRGEPVLEELASDVNFVVLLSLLENDIASFVPGISRTAKSPILGVSNFRAPVPYKRDFESKLRTFHRRLASAGYAKGPSRIELQLRRDHVLEDAYAGLISRTSKQLKQSRLYVKFAGEEGLDYGGLSREFFFLISRELFNPYYGLFEYSANDCYTVQVSSVSAFVDNANEWFRFCGRILGLCIIHQCLLDAFFTRPFYKTLLQKPCTLSDLEALDEQFHSSMTWMMENDVTDVMDDLTFTVDEEVFGQLTTRELKPGGDSIQVTERTKREYVDLMTQWRIDRGVSEQRKSLVRGLHEVIQPSDLKLFDAEELELVISGTVEIDIGDWRTNTDYRSGYHNGHRTIKWFWAAVEKFDNERRLRLLQFVTGTSSIPYEGFAALRGSNGPRKFCIDKWGTPKDLPRAHTCFNRLDLPAYRSFNQLVEKLTTAIEFGSAGFGME